MATLRQHAGRTILVVDDNETNVLLMTTLLRQHGLTRVHTVTDSRNAATALADVRPDIVKLDISLIAGIDTSPEQRALVRALVGFAEEVGSRVIAEGIEREAELDVVRGLGVHWGQGYLLGRPAPPDAVPGLT